MMIQISFFNRILNESITATSYRRFFSVVAAQLKAIIPFDMIMAYRLQPDNSTARLLYQEGIPEERVEEIRNICIRVPLLAPVYAQGQSEYIEDISSQPPFMQCRDLKVIVRIPLKDENGVIGSLHLAGKQHHVFTEWERTFLDTLGIQVGFIVLTLQFRKELVESNSRANLYLDILTHDINNTIQAPAIYTELLSESLTGNEKEALEKIKISLKSAAGILKDVDTIRLIHKTAPVLSRVGLDEIIRGEIGLRPDISITYAGTNIAVLADALLKEIFTNIIGNSIKYAGNAVQIGIEIEDLENEAGIRITDNGPGVPDNKKPLLFHRFSRATDQKAGKGLGLYIIASLVARYGGIIRAENRVPGKAEEGFAVYFTLKKYREPVLSILPECGAKK
ncbi:MAG: GAF domain-containing sensor histidine kinase [Methanoregula sp.]|jgi:signal transduction histidine kinase